MKRKSLLMTVTMLIILIMLTACTPDVHTTVSNAVRRGQSGDWVRLTQLQVQELSHDPIMSQTSFRLVTEEGDQRHLIAVASNNVVSAGLEQLRLEAKNLVIDMEGRLDYHDDLGWLMFVGKLEVLD